MRDIARAIEHGLRQLRCNLRAQIIRKALHMLEILVKMRHADLARLGERRDIRQRFGARAHPLFLPAAKHQWRQTQAFFDIQRANALGRADLVAGYAHQVAIPLFRRELDACQPLHRVDVEQRTRRFRLEHRAEFRHRLYRADLVVDQLAGQQHGILGQCGLERHGRDMAGFVRREENHIIPLDCELLCGVDGRCMLDLGRDNPPLLMAV